MSKFVVTIKRELTAIEEVEAESQREAEDKAEAMANDWRWNPASGWDTSTQEVFSVEPYSR